ncbi:hypothetical protein NHX12_019857 [Muraenolepis orangiensis]|uniref:Uncharacterized protein n=1 Tax=Muraenolepis orangiensis TaxID=630683 RepID=A0A9Q0EUC7_9TELE|nr:hypothetical protein NHX12_019857 [Muraenolepis orangiensis]
MDLKMLSIPEPPTAGSEVSCVIKRICLKRPGGLVDLLVEVTCEAKGARQSKREETASRHIHSNGDSHRVPVSAFPSHQTESPPPPHQLETCFLANILHFQQNLSEKATLFLNSVLNKQINGVVEDVLMPKRIVLLDIPLISKYLCRAPMATKVDPWRFKSLVLSSLDSPEGQSSSLDPPEGQPSSLDPPEGQPSSLDPPEGQPSSLDPLRDSLPLWTPLRDSLPLWTPLRDSLPRRAPPVLNRPTPAAHRKLNTDTSTSNCSPTSLKTSR